MLGRSLVSNLPPKQLAGVVFEEVYFTIVGRRGTRRYRTSGRPVRRHGTVVPLDLGTVVPVATVPYRGRCGTYGTTVPWCQ